MTPFITSHNDLAGLNDGDYKHLTATQYAANIYTTNGDVRYALSGRVLPNEGGTLTNWLSGTRSAWSTEISGLTGRFSNLIVKGVDTDQRYTLSGLFPQATLDARYVTTAIGNTVYALSGNILVDSLADTVIGGLQALASGHVLSYNGTNWINAAGGGGGSIATLTDVTLTSVASGEILIYDGLVWRNGVTVAGSGNWEISGTSAALAATLPSLYLASGLYYTQAASEARYVNVTGDYISGTLEMSGIIRFGDKTTIVSGGVFSVNVISGATVQAGALTVRSVDSDTRYTLSGLFPQATLDVRYTLSGLFNQATLDTRYHASGWGTFVNAVGTTLVSGATVFGGAVSGVNIFGTDAVSGLSVRAGAVIVRGVDTDSRYTLSGLFPQATLDARYVTTTVGNTAYALSGRVLPLEGGILTDILSGTQGVFNNRVSGLLGQFEALTVKSVDTDSRYTLSGLIPQATLDARYVTTAIGNTAYALSGRVLPLEGGTLTNWLSGTASAWSTEISGLTGRFNNLIVKGVDTDSRYTLSGLFPQTTLDARYVTTTVGNTSYALSGRVLPLEGGTLTSWLSGTASAWSTEISGLTGRFNNLFVKGVDTDSRYTLSGLFNQATLDVRYAISGRIRQDSLDDTVIGGLQALASGHVLSYNGTNWINAAGGVGGGITGGGTSGKLPVFDATNNITNSMVSQTIGVPYVFGASSTSVNTTRVSGNLIIESIGSETRTIGISGTGELDGLATEPHLHILGATTFSGTAGSVAVRGGYSLRRPLSQPAYFQVNGVAGDVGGEPALFTIKGESTTEAGTLGGHISLEPGDGGTGAEDGMVYIGADFQALLSTSGLTTNKIFAFPNQAGIFALSGHSYMKAETDQRYTLSGLIYQDSLADTVIGGAAGPAASGHYLAYNGTNWINANATGAQGPSGVAGATYLSGLTDVQPTAWASGNVLRFDGTLWRPVTFPASTANVSGIKVAMEGGFTKPTNQQYSHVKIQVWAGGGGGALVGAGTGGGGGGGGAYNEVTYPYSLIPNNLVIIVGSGGAGAQVAANGTTGGNSSVSGAGVGGQLGVWVPAFAGGGGSTSLGGGGGGGQQSAGTIAAAGGLGGGPGGGAAAVSTSGGASIAGGGGGGTNVIAAPGGASYYGGGGGGGGSATTTASAGGASVWGGGGGGGAHDTAAATHGGASTYGGAGGASGGNGAIGVSGVAPAGGGGGSEAPQVAGPGGVGWVIITTY
jgi:hypothetical protein